MTRANGTGGTSDGFIPVPEAALVHREPAGGAEKAREAEDRVSEHGSRRGELVDLPGAAPDGGWGWVVLAATIVVLALTLAFPSCVGIFYTDLQNEFHASNSETSWVPSIMTSVLHAGGKGDDRAPNSSLATWSMCNFNYCKHFIYADVFIRL